MDATLAAAHLPAALETSLRGRFGGTVFQPPALQAAIREARQLVSELTGGMVIQGAGRISEMASYRKLLGDILLKLPHVRESKSYIVMEEVKESLNLPIAD